MTAQQRCNILALRGAGHGPGGTLLGEGVCFQDHLDRTRYVCGGSTGPVLQGGVVDVAKQR